MSGAVKFKHKSRTNPQLTHEDKLMRAYQDLQAKLTGKPETRGAEDFKQLRALVDTMVPDKVDAELLQLRKEVATLRAIVAPRVQEGTHAAPGPGEPGATPSTASSPRA